MKNPVSQLTLPSGARLLHIPTANRQLSYVSAWFCAGARFDPPGKTGLAHFFEHLYGETTEKHPEKNALVRRLEQSGVRFNAYTSMETAHFYCQQPQDETLPAIEYLQEIVEETTIDQKILEDEKSVIINEEKENRDNPGAYIWRLRNKALWPNSPLGNGFYGNDDSIKNITKTDILNFKQDFYTADNLTFLVASGHDTSELKERFSGTTVPAQANHRQSKPVGKVQHVLTEKRDLSQTTLVTAFRGASIYSDDYPGVDLLLHILVNSWISKITRRLRVEEHISYWPSGSTEHFSDTGYLSLELTVENKHVRKALEVTLHEVSQLKTSMLTRDELDAFKKSFTSSFWQNTETLEDVAWWYGWQATLGVEKPLGPEAYLEIISGISPPDLQKIAQTYLRPERRSVVTIGGMAAEEIEEILTSFAG